MLWGSAIVRRVTVVRLAGAVSSGVLLALAYAPFEQHETAWVALVPLILISSRSGTRAALGWGFLGGAVFWLVSLSWFSRLAWTGPSACLGLLAWFFLALYCALYTAAFAMLVSGLFGSLGTDNWRRTVLLTVAIPAVWVGARILPFYASDRVPVEYTRSQPVQEHPDLPGRGVGWCLCCFHACCAYELRVRHDGTQVSRRCRWP